MSTVVDFPGGRRPPTLPPLGDPWDPQARAADEAYALATLERMLPAEARRHVAGTDLKLIVSAMLRDVDLARHERRCDPWYDQRRVGGEAQALAQLFEEPARSAETGPAAPLDAGEADEPDWQGRREADALAAMFTLPASEPEGAA